MKKLQFVLILCLLFFLMGCPNPHPIPREDHVNLLKNTTVTIKIIENDRISYNDYEIKIIDYPKHGEVVLNDDETLSYTPNTDYIGADEMTYELDDGEDSGYTEPVKVYLKIKQENVAPVAITDTIAIFEKNHDIMINVLENDLDEDNDYLHVFIKEPPKHGYVNLEYVYLDSLSKHQLFFYRPKDGFYGKDEFTYVLTDDITSKIGKVNIIYMPIEEDK